MYDKKSHKKLAYILIILLVFLIFVLFQIKTKAADPYANLVKIKDAKITSINTGTSDFDNIDGLNYDDINSYSLDTGYIAGNDANENNRIVRSFDSITYNFTFSIESKIDDRYLEDRMVSINTILSEEEKKYISNDSNLSISVSSINTYENEYTASITLYITGAPNGFKIDPRFEIKESTDTDVNTIVKLGLIDDNNHNYEYTDGKYSNISTIDGFRNYMPTVVSSSSNSINIYVKSSNENPKATYNGKLGRYMNFVIGLELVGSDNKGIKGSCIPEGDISFDFNIDNNSVFDERWLRVYSPDVLDDIPSVLMQSPYGIKVTSDNSVYSNSSGSINISKISDGSYRATISNYKIDSLDFPVKNADNSPILNGNGVFASYQLTLFSERAKESNKNDINSEVQITNLNGRNISLEELTDINPNDNVATGINTYYESSDYKLTGEFVDFSNNDIKISKDGNGKGSASKGEELAYKSTFNYKKASSDLGLKQIIKIDPIAFRVIRMSTDEDIKLELKCGGKSCNNIKKDDFDINFVTGDYINSNYTVTNTDLLDERLLDEDKNIIKSQCSNVKSNISKYNSNQIMNLYGGPCIKVNEKIEGIYKNILDAQDKESNELPITKIIIQTKKGVKLPDNIEIKVIVGLRVRNIKDITQTYPVTTMAMTSDYDNKLIYYAPMVTNDDNSITSANNYKKSIYNGNVLESTSFNPWGDSLKVVSYTARNIIDLLNTNKDGSVKNTFNTKDNDIIKFKIQTNIDDLNQNVGADDVWWINNLNVTINLPNTLDYIEDTNIGTPIITHNGDGTTTLVYNLPYTKPNMKINDIRFNAKLKPNIKGKVPIIVTSKVNAVNINNEIDTSIIGSTTSSYTIYATGVNGVVSLQKNGGNSTIVEKNKEFSYLLSAYNNTENDTLLNILDILPYNGDKNGSLFSGDYKVKVILPDSLKNTKVYCSDKKTPNISSLSNDETNNFKECNITSEYVYATAVKLEGLYLSSGSYLDDIKVLIKPNGNKYSNTYNNSFYSNIVKNMEDDEKIKEYEFESNKVDIKVVSRNISGRVFVDNNSDGIENLNDTYLKDISVVLYRLNSNNDMDKVSETITNEKGEYIFKDLDTGRYKVQLKYDSKKYDLTLRYAHEDTTNDSDAYKISDTGLAEISSKVVKDDLIGIKLDDNIESVADMNMGLIPRYQFGFEMRKYITKIDLNSNNMLSTLNYNNENKVSISVKNSSRTTARIYYGISITNNSTKPGYIKLIQENIPKGLIFNPNDDYNKQWFSLNGNIYSKIYENDIVKPGETKYLQIVLDMPKREEAGTFLSTATIVEMQAYDEKNIDENEYINEDDYHLGEQVNYGGVDFHIIGIDGDNLTLLADSKTINTTMSHKNLGPYKWSESNINNFINNKWSSENSLDLSILLDNKICDDASGLPKASYGGSLISEGKCQTGIYKDYKVRLLTESEFLSLQNTLNDISWLNGNYWLMNSSYIKPIYDDYGIQTNSIANMARAVIGTNVQDKNITDKLEIRPVIVVSSKNVIME